MHEEYETNLQLAARGYWVRRWTEQLETCSATDLAPQSAEFRTALVCCRSCSMLLCEQTCGVSPSSLDVRMHRHRPGYSNTSGGAHRQNVVTARRCTTLHCRCWCCTPSTSGEHSCSCSQ